MPETLALLRISLAKSRFLLTVMFVALAIGQLIALLAMPFQPETGGEIAFAVLYYSIH